MAVKCRLLNFVGVILTVSLFCVALLTEVKLKSLISSDDDDQSSLAVYVEHYWNQDLMAFLCTGGIEVMITRWHLCC